MTKKGNSVDKSAVALAPKVRLDYLDGLRGVAALIVVVSHYAELFWPVMHNFNEANPVHSRFDLLMFQTPLQMFVSGRLGLKIFFVLSGFVLTKKIFEGAKTDIGKKILLRYVRLAPMVAFSVALGWLLLVLNMYYVKQAATLTGSYNFLYKEFEIVNFSKLAFLAFIDPFINSPASVASFNYPLWTIYIEFLGSFIVLPLASSLRNSRYRWAAYTVLVIAFSNTHYLSFLGGMILADIYINKKTVISHFSNLSAWLKSILLLSTLVIGAVTEAAAKNQGPLYAALIGDTGSSYLISHRYSSASALLLVLFFLSWRPLQRLFSKKLILYLGKISFALYVLHAIVLQSFTSALFIRLEPSMNYNLAAAISSVVGILVTIPLAIWATKLIEEPVLRLLRRLNKTKNLANPW